MPSRLRLADPSAVADALASRADGRLDRSETRLLVTHYLALLSRTAPGRAVEVRVPPYAAAQCVPGATHTRGTPPAVVETDAETWIGLALGEIAWSEAAASGGVRASGERSNLSSWFPL